ncbi:hypothetical protein [Microbacterium sp. SORGH_AS_0862]|uniref:hypothetical protein n=1 Tax=Microbacterium sp. SORGH_AS_0862 TaxID=3041789 RepID=UPI00278D52BA|nr:hypothetical protein [Microbacterium sp. SORGH_AS_0862]MDQ1205177.1 hypothetical protein [Microbacterium sp. SORGH_AS_0862]
MTTPAALAASGSSFASPYSGSKLLDSGHALSQAVRNGDWLEGGLAFLDTLGNAAAALADPIGTLASIGLGWVMKYLKPLSTWLDQLAGSEANVAAVAQQWTNAGSALRETGNTLVTRLSDLDGLSGDTVRTYVRFAQDTAQHIAASGDWADAAAGGLRNASSLVAKMQGVVKNAISQVVATAIEAMAVVAASFGLGIGYAIARVVTKVNQLVNKVVRPLTQVVRSVKSLVGFVQQLGSLFKSTERLSSTILGGGATSATITAGDVVDASGATRLGNTAQANLVSAGQKADDWHFTPTAVVSTGVGAEGTLTADGSTLGSAGLGNRLRRCGPRFRRRRRHRIRRGVRNRRRGRRRRRRRHGQPVVDHGHGCRSIRRDGGERRQLPCRGSRLPHDDARRHDGRREPRRWAAQRSRRPSGGSRDRHRGGCGRG